MRSVATESSTHRPRSIGFPRSQDSTLGSVPAVAAPTLLANRPLPQIKSTSHKGRWFVTIIIGSLLAFVAISLWNAFFHYQAFGTLEGTVVRLSTSTPSRVRTMLVKEGDVVQVGQLLAEFDVQELTLRRSEVERQIETAILDLQVRAIELSAVQRQTESDQLDRQIRYLQLLGDFHLSQSRLEELSNTYNNNQRLLVENAVSKSELLSSKTAYEGRKSQLADLSSAIQAYEQSAQRADHDDAMTRRLVDDIAKLETFRSELSELDEMIRQAREIRAPVAGRILKRHSHPGEVLQSNQAVLELVQSGSVQAVVYLPQSRAKSLAIGDTIAMTVKPLGTQQSFRVQRIASEVVAPPAALQTRYAANRGLVRVYAEPFGDDDSADLTSWIGGELMLSRFGYRMVKSVANGPIAQRTVTGQQGAP